MIWPTTPTSASRSVYARYFAPGCVGNRERNGVAFDLRGPSRHIAEEVHGERDVGGLGDVQRFAVVETFDVAELLGMLFEQIGEFPDEASALGRGHAAPGAVVKGIARGLYRLINVFAIAFRDLRENFSGGGIVSGESFARGGIHPPAID